MIIQSYRATYPLAVVVGAGAMGLAMARRLGNDHRLLLADMNEQTLASAKTALEAEGHDVSLYPVDITDAASVEALENHCQSLGPVKALCHVAGLSVDAQDPDIILSVNLDGAKNIEAAFRGKLTVQGAAVFISSGSVHLVDLPPELRLLAMEADKSALVHAISACDHPMGAAGLAYVTSKLALEKLCRRQSALWAVHGHRILALAPGLIATPMGVRSYEKAPAKYDLFKAIPMQREGSMLEMAEIAAFMLSSKASYMTGVTLVADGGLSAALKSNL